MEFTRAIVEPVTSADILGLATWNRQRTDEELRSFVAERHAALPDDTTLE